MKKRLIIPALILSLLLVLTFPVLAMERTTNARLYLSFSGTTASCTAAIKGNGAINATLQLWQGSALIASWSGTGTNQLTIHGTSTVSHGQIYTLTVTGTVGEAIINAMPVTGTCS